MWYILPRTIIVPAVASIVCALWVQAIAQCLSYKFAQYSCGCFVPANGHVRVAATNKGTNEELNVGNHDAHIQQTAFARELNARLVERLSKKFSSSSEHLTEVTRVASEIFPNPPKDEHFHLFNLSQFSPEFADQFGAKPYAKLQDCITPIYLAAIRYWHEGVERLAIDGTSNSLVGKTYLALMLSALHGNPLDELASIFESKGRTFEQLSRFTDGISQRICQELFRLIGFNTNKAAGYDDSEADMDKNDKFQFKRLVPKPALRNSLYRRSYGFEVHDLYRLRSKNSSPNKVAMLISGGVDSSVALWMLKSQGYNVHAFYLKAFGSDSPGCTVAEDIRYATDCCNVLGVPLHILPVEDVYNRAVMQYMVEGYRAGNTPNPDVICNREVKFGYFLNLATSEFGFDMVASGHYARINPQYFIPPQQSNGTQSSFVRFNELETSYYVNKDQTYFLSRLSSAQLGKMICPLGVHKKKMVRALAYINGLGTQARDDSMGVCFLGRLDLRQFLKAHLGETPGQIIDYKSKQVIGQHTGLYNYTIGQRQGLGVSIDHGGEEGGWFVVSKDAASNTLYVTKEYNSRHFTGRSCIRRAFSLAHVRWNNPILLNSHGINEADYIKAEWEPPITRRDIKTMQDLTLDRNVASTEKLFLKVRNGTVLYEAELKLSPPIRKGQGVTQHGWAVLDRSDPGLATGQYAALYRGNICIGSGIIYQSF